MLGTEGEFTTFSMPTHLGDIEVRAGGGSLLTLFKPNSTLS